MDGDSEENGLDAVTGTQVTLKRVSGGTQRSVGMFVQDVIVPLPQLSSHSARGLIAGAITMVTTSRQPDRRGGEQRAIACRLVAIPSRARAQRRGTPHSSRGRVGRHRLGVPRADVERALSPVPRRPDAHAREQHARPRRLVGGEAGVTVAASPNVTLRTTWFDNRVRIRFRM